MKRRKRKTRARRHTWDIPGTILSFDRTPKTTTHVVVVPGRKRSLLATPAPRRLRRVNGSFQWTPPTPPRVVSIDVPDMVFVATVSKTTGRHIQLHVARLDSEMQEQKFLTPVSILPLPNQLDFWGRMCLGNSTVNLDAITAFFMSRFDASPGGLRKNFAAKGRRTLLLEMLTRGS